MLLTAANAALYTAREWLKAMEQEQEHSTALGSCCLLALQAAVQDAS